MATCSTAQLADDRVRAAGELQTAIAVLKRAFGNYNQKTRALEFRTDRVELDRYLVGGITLHLVDAGFAPFLEQKLHGPAPDLAGANAALTTLSVDLSMVAATGDGSGTDPATIVGSRESVRLALVAALQHLPPRQCDRLAIHLCLQRFEIKLQPAQPQPGVTIADGRRDTARMRAISSSIATGLTR